MTLPCAACQRPLDIEGYCLNLECALHVPKVEPEAEREPMDDAKTLAHVAEDLFTRMKAYADSDPLRSSWVRAFVERYAMKLGKLIQEDESWREEASVGNPATLMAYARTIVNASEEGANGSDRPSPSPNPGPNPGSAPPPAPARKSSCTCSIGDVDRFGASPTCDVHGLGARCPTCDQALNSAGVCPACGKRP